MDKDVVESGFTVAKEWVGLTGVVVGFVLNLAYGSWGKRKQTKKDRYYLALMVITHLDKFFDECCAYCSDNGRPDEQGCYYPVVPMPAFELPELNVDWRCLSPELMKDILWFPSAIHQSKQMIDSVNEHAYDPPCFEQSYETQHYEFSRLALTAHRLSNELRDVAGLPKRITDEEYFRPYEFLSGLGPKIESIREERDKQNRSMLEMMRKGNNI